MDDDDTVKRHPLDELFDALYPPGQLIFCRELREEGDPDARWDDERGVWVESDEHLRARIKATLAERAP